MDPYAVRDVQMSNFAAGFTVGFGIWTVTSAVKRSRACANPWRSIFLFMVWGEILVNGIMAILAWLVLNTYLKHELPYNLATTFLWVFELHFYYQIIINRVAVVSNDEKTVFRLKWGTALLVTLINISAFLLWVPNQGPHPWSLIGTNINKYWDRISKAILCILDAYLNWYFLREVRLQLVNFHGLTKYKSLIRFNAWLMVVSVGMDVLLIGIESLAIKENSQIYQPFHPITYLVKLHIELSLAALIAKIARNRHPGTNDVWPPPSPILRMYQPAHAAPLAVLDEDLYERSKTTLRVEESCPGIRATRELEIRSLHTKDMDKRGSREIERRESLLPIITRDEAEIALDIV